MLLLSLPLTVAAALTVVAGVVGALILGSAGRRVDRRSLEGLPEDELFLYRDALRQGRTVLLVRITDPDKKAEVKELLGSAQPEDIDPARADHEVGIQSAEQLRYDPPKQVDHERSGRQVPR